MLVGEIRFSKHHQALVAFPTDQRELLQAIKVLELTIPRPVLVLSGGFIERRYETITKQAIEAVAKAAAQRQALVQSGGTDMGVMATIGRVRAQSNYDFPLLGITVEGKVTWPGGPQERRFFWQKKRRGPLEPHHTHFILVPGDQFGDETPWFVQAATFLSEDKPSVTILVNGGGIARQEVVCSLEVGRPVVVLAGTGRLADELASEPPPSEAMTIIPADDKQVVFETILTLLTK